MCSDSSGFKFWSDARGVRVDLSLKSGQAMREGLNEVSFDAKLFGEVGKGSSLTQVVLLIGGRMQAGRAGAVLRRSLRHIFDVRNGDSEVD